MENQFSREAIQRKNLKNRLNDLNEELSFKDTDSSFLGSIWHLLSRWFEK